MLTIYRASAGSGKTYTLTGEYLTLLFSSSTAYRRILAVTFTNKATDEMKSRIVEELYNLSSGRQSGYVSLLSGTFSMDEHAVRKQARTILISILHDYSAFNISTIDRFFQQTMRAFTREIGLQGGYGLEMDQDMVLTEAIDNLLASLEKPENKELLGWLIRFAEDKVENGSEWNLRKDISQLSREIFKESYKAFEKDVKEDITDKKALEAYKETLYSIIRSEESRAKELGEKGLSVLKRFNLAPDDFKGGSRSPLFFLQKLVAGEMKEPSATFCGLADNTEAAFTAKTSPEIRQTITAAFDGGLNACILEIVQLFSNQKAYLTAREVVRFYYTLGILNDVSSRIMEYRKDKNIMLIADTTELLNKVIGGSDAPFIYEKTGVNVDNYMIDEFQDTSGMQWNNFRPLIKESLAHDRFNLIVGDVKQSIYRFRNSDWKLLDQQVGVDFRQEGVTDKVLDVNWRSCRCIVEFNNAFFTTAPLLLQAMFNQGLESSTLSETEQQYINEKIVRAYDKLYQLVPDRLQDKDGHVRIEFMEATDDADWKELALARLPSVIEQLQDNGYALRDIAILVRTNNDGARVADTLLNYKDEYPSEHYKYDIISDDALFIASSSAVRFLVAILRYMRNPEDTTSRRMAVFDYMLITTPQEQDNISSQVVFENDFPPEIKYQLQVLSRESLYEITEGLLRLFNDYFKDSEQVFIQAFLDMVLEYTEKESADISRFLKWWDEKGCRKTIVTPDAQDAIRILTVHKSKGLGFKAVILPFGEWEIDHKPMKPVVLWCHPEEKPFNKLHLVPVRYSSTLSKTIFAREYYEEKLHAYIDNLNTLYVAFTRAKEELIVFSPRPEKEDKIAGMSGLLWIGLQTACGTSTRDGMPLADLASSFDEENGVFESGQWWHPAAKGKDDKLQAEEIEMKRIVSVTPQDRLRLRLRGKGFFFDNEQRKHGTLMHDVLSKIRTSKDIFSSVESYRFAGVIDKSESDVLVKRLTQLLASSQIASWFDGSSSVLNEVDILFGNGLSKRPDRVMINGRHVVVVDYKFGLLEDRKYHSQIRNYVKLIRQMGYEEVKGYIWYVELSKIEQVNS